jgi:ketosteroid isomerase-like protein
MSAKTLALEFLSALDARDAAAALALVEPSAPVELVPVAAGTAGSDGRRAIEELVAAFPDLGVRVRSLMGTPARAVAEVTVEGTQGRDFWGIDNQEKHMDVDQAWLFETEGDRITAIRAYWCQNQLYRRLAVKRLDNVSITAGARG